jgi:hypothetical protein
MSRFESLTPWSRTWVPGANFVVTQSFEWCFNRLILAQSRQFWPNVNPQLQPRTIYIETGDNLFVSASFFSSFPDASVDLLIYCSFVIFERQLDSALNALPSVLKGGIA